MDWKGGLAARFDLMKDAAMAATEKDDATGCDLCGRDVPLTFHHLIPRAVHKRKRFVREHGKREMQSRGLMLCRLCHSAIHEFIPNEKHLAEAYNTKEALLQNEKIARHVAWASRQKSRFK